MSDHRVLKFNFKISSNKRGSGYWKLNSTYINNDDYKKKIRDIVHDVDNQNDLDALQKWEMFKEVRDFSIDFSKSYHCNLKKKIVYIEKEIESIEDKKRLLLRCIHHF